MAEAVPARLHVLLARSSTKAVIIRRGPSKLTAAIGWDRAVDSFAVGQWLKGKLYHFRSDLSPDGRHWIYFAMSAKGQTWTAMAKAPYFKALDFYPKGDAWNGGGLFANNHSYWLNDAGPTLHEHARWESGLTVLDKWGGEEIYQGECPGIYFIRLRRDGWAMGDAVAQGDGKDRLIRFHKHINNYWKLVKLFHMGLNHPAGKGVYYESHILCSSNFGEEIPFPNMDWADLDDGRLLWAEKGQLFSGVVTKDGLAGEKLLFDANTLAFEEITAPY